MPVHDWTRVTAGTFHDFHTRWISHITEALNEGLLPRTYYAQAELKLRGMEPDVVTLSVEPNAPPHRENGGTVTMAPPKTMLHLKADTDAVYRLKRRTIVIRNTSGHQVVAIVEIVSPANKDRRESVQSFVDKIDQAISGGIHVLLVDLFPPGPSDPLGLHPKIWKAIEPHRQEVGLDRPLCLAAYEALELPEAFLEPISVGDALPDMPLFYDSGLYVNVPLEATYQQAWRGVPEFWRDVIEGRRTADM
jgi:hypothetical protein